MGKIIDLFVAHVNAAFVCSKYLRYWKYHLSFDDGEIFANIV